MPDSEPIIPEYITVHLGNPASKAENIRVSFPDYIKNVASSEIYPTWPQNSLRANIYAFTTYALNRVYTQYYKSKGFDFDITNSLEFDQEFTPGRDVFENVGQIVDDIFNDYVVKQGQNQPYFTQYCAETCNGMSKWGTISPEFSKDTPIEILKYYYGDNIDIIKNAPIKGSIELYKNKPLRMGDTGDDVSTIQRQLNRIASNYPSIKKIPNISGTFGKATYDAVKQFQKIFSLMQDGIVGKATWYRMQFIYNAIKELSEVYSEGITIPESQRRFQRELKKGDTGSEVKVLQYYLDFISYFNPGLPKIDVDGIFGEETNAAVTAFQRLYGLDVDGIVGKNTWNMLQDAYEGVLLSLPDEYKSYSSLIYPGYLITVGASGKVVEQLQTYLKKIAENDSRVPAVVVDGYYGNITESAVKAVQKINGLPQTGQVGPMTWNAVINMYNDYR
jgi:peptidoglycan hydrolase-like protein with peptidoglycan-binding domain